MVNTSSSTTAAKTAARLHPPPGTNAEPVHHNHSNNSNHKMSNNAPPPKYTSSSTAPTTTTTTTTTTRTKLVFPVRNPRHHHDDDDDNVSVSSAISVQSQRDARERELLQLRQQRAAMSGGGLAAAALHNGQWPPTVTATAAAKGTGTAAAGGGASQPYNKQQQQQQSRGRIGSAAAAVVTKKKVNVVNPYFRPSYDSDNDDDDEEEEDDGGDDDDTEQDLESLLLYHSPHASPKSSAGQNSFREAKGKGNPERQQQQRAGGGGGLHLLSSLPHAPGLSTSSIHIHTAAAPNALDESMYFSCHGSHASEFSIVSGDLNTNNSNHDVSVSVSVDSDATPLDNTNDPSTKIAAAPVMPTRQQQQIQQHPKQHQVSFDDQTLHHCNLSPRALTRKLKKSNNSNSTLPSTGTAPTIPITAAAAASSTAAAAAADGASLNNNDSKRPTVGTGFLRPTLTAKVKVLSEAEKDRTFSSLSKNGTFHKGSEKRAEQADDAVVEKAHLEKHDNNNDPSQAGERNNPVVEKAHEQQEQPHPPSSLSETCSETPPIETDNKATINLKTAAATDKTLTGHVPARHEAPPKAPQKQIGSSAADVTHSSHFHKEPTHAAIDPKLLATPTATAKPAAASRLELMQQAKSLSGSVRNMMAMFEHSSSNHGTPVTTNTSNTSKTISSGGFYLEKEHADCKKKNSLLLPPQLHLEPPAWKKQQQQQKQEQKEKMLSKFQQPHHHQPQADPVLTAAPTTAAPPLPCPETNPVPPHTQEAIVQESEATQSTMTKQSDATLSGATGTDFLLLSMQTTATLPSQQHEKALPEPERNVLASASLQTAEETLLTSPLHFHNKFSSATVLHTPAPNTFKSDHVPEKVSMQQQMMNSKLKTAVEFSSTTLTAMPLTPGGPVSPDAPRISVLLSSFSPGTQVQMPFPASPTEKAQRGGPPTVEPFVSSPPLAVSKAASATNLQTQTLMESRGKEMRPQAEHNDEQKIPATPLQPHGTFSSPLHKQYQCKVAPKQTVKALFQWRAANIKQGAPCPPKQKPMYDEDSDYEYESYHSDSPGTPGAPNTQGLPEKSYVPTPSEYARAQLGLPNVCKSKYSRQLKLASMPALVDDTSAVPVGQRKYVKTPIDYARAQLGISNVCKSKYEQQLKLAQLATSGGDDDDDDDDTNDTGGNDAGVDSNEDEEEEIADNDDDIIDLEGDDGDMELESDEEYIVYTTEEEFTEETERNDDLHHHNFISMDAAKENPAELTSVIINILRRERAIQEGYVTSEQVKTIMELPVEELMLILNHLEPGMGKDVDWETLTDIIPIIVEETADEYEVTAHESGDDDDEDENADLDSTNHWSTHNMTGDPCAIDVDFGDGYSLQAESTRCDSSVTCTDDEIIEEIVYTDTDCTVPKDGNDR